MRFLIFLFILAPFLLLAEKTVPQFTTPEEEYRILLQNGKTTHAPLSKALKELITGIGDRYFDETFFQKLEEAEATQFDGEYLDRWPSGQLKIKAIYKNGKVDGHVHGWYEDGLEAFKAFFYEEMKVGIHIAFFPYEGPYRRWSEAVARLINYNLKSQLDEKQLSNYYDGRLKSYIIYKKSLQNGELSFYDASRQCLRKESYKKGRLTKTTVD